MPMTGVSLVAFTDESFGGSRFGLSLFAERPRSLNSKGSIGGKVVFSS